MSTLNIHVCPDSVAVGSYGFVNRSQVVCSRSRISIGCTVVSTCCVCYIIKIKLSNVSLDESCNQPLLRRSVLLTVSRFRLCSSSVLVIRMYT